MIIMKAYTRVFLIFVVLVSVVDAHKFSDDEAWEAAVEAAGTDHIPMYYNDPQDEPVIYDAYFGKPVTTKRRNYLAGITNGTIVKSLKQLPKELTHWTQCATASYSDRGCWLMYKLCTVRVEPCNKSEGRRVDGTCTNPKYPSRGATLTPLPRLLPPMFGQGNTLRPAEDGSELPSTRLLRTTLLGDGYLRDHDFSILSTHVFVFSFVDNVDLVYLLRYTFVSDCCLANVRNTVNPLCIAIPVPQDDPYLRRTGVRCLNLTRVETYQDFGCLPRSLPAERYNRVPPLLDLSVIYGNTKERSDEIRLSQGGLLQFRMEGDREVPDGQSPFCFSNTPPEVVCYNYGDNFQGNLLPGIYLTAMWFFREHNRIARKLSIINPCWEDEKLFQTARQVNIAQWQYIFYYELVGILLGRKNALAEGIIHDTHKHVNDFDPNYEPGVYREYVVAGRWFHTYQPALFDLYRNRRYVGSRSAVNDNGRSGILPLNNTEGDLTEGSIIQPADDFDLIIDPDLAERYIGEDQVANDLPAVDMSRGRDAGLPPYNHYRKLCGLKVARKWEDYEDTISKDKVESLRRLYDSVDDVELMVAIYVEKLLPKAYVGPTLYCIMVQNLLLWRRSDKFFFEHGGFPAALTVAQLREIKKHSIARILCDNGDGIREIQPNAMLRRKLWNAPVPCSEIDRTDLTKWKDRRCYPKQ